MRGRYLLVRHTRPAIEAGICYGRMDLDLAPTWPLDFEECLARIPAAARIFSSPSSRCRRLAEALGRRDRVDVGVDMRLAEIDFGRWEGRYWDDIPRDDIDRWAADTVGYAPGGGESLRMLWERVLAWRGEMLQGFRGGRSAGDTVIVSHHGPLRALAAQWDGKSMASLFDYHIPWGGMRTLG